MGMPVAYALGIAAILAALYAGIPLEAVMLKVAGGMSGFSLLAIPFFILTGAIMAVGGMAERLVNLAKVFVGFIRGGMALVNIVASTMFGCISGSSVADTAAVGSVMIPQMIKNGYPRLFAVNVTISGSLQPLLVPPSHNMIIYSIAAGGTISVAHLFMGGIIPALLLGLSLIILVLIIAHRDKFPRGEIVPLRKAVKIAIDAIWGMITIAIILGGILSGIFTPTESGAVACIYAFLVTMFVYRDCKWSEVPKLIARVVRTVGMVMIMIGFSIAFGYMMAIMRIPAKATEFFVAISSDKYTFLLLRYRPRTFRYHHDPQSRDRPAHSAGGPNYGGRLRDRPREHGGCFTQHPDLLRADADRARTSDLPARTVTLVAATAPEIADLGRIRDARASIQVRHKEYPPSTTSVCAVTILVSAQRNTIAAAISTGVQARLSSERSIAACLRAAGQGRVQSVSTNPGATAFARASGASARAKFWVRLMRPALLAP